MKTSIITALLLLGVLLQPVPVSNASPATAASQHQATLQSPTAVEMNAAVGGGINGCYEFKGPDNDIYGTCCLDLWLFAVCITVNESAIARFVSSIF